MKKILSVLLVLMCIITSTLIVSAESVDKSPNVLKPKSKTATEERKSATKDEKAVKAVKPHLSNDGSIDNSYYLAGRMPYTIEDYPIPAELKFNSKNPIEGQLRRDTKGRLWFYNGTDGAGGIDTWGLITTDVPEKQVYPLYIGGYEFNKTAKQMNIYSGVGTPKGNQRKVESGRMYVYSPLAGWIPDLGGSGTEHMGILSQCSKSGLSFEKYLGFEFAD